MSLVVVVVVVVAERRYKLSAQVLPGLHWWENSSPAPGGLLWDRSHLVRCSFTLSRTILSLDNFFVSDPSSKREHRLSPFPFINTSDEF